ncbi:hypothetical protein GGF32_005781 [Allomyces javanicus]|nr:hypothetical protein GGF32_005781 [Allomyces javanicus]
MTARAKPTRSRRSAAWWSTWAPVAAWVILATLVQVSSATADPSVRVAAPRSPPSPADHALGNAVNAEIYPLVNQLVKSPFFRYVKVDLHKPCPFWKENFKCMNQDCVVQVMDEGKVRTEAPFMYQDVNLGDIKPMPAALGGSAPSGRGALGGSGPAAPGGLNFFSQCQFAKDFCVLEDESSANGEYVDLQENPERFTGYSGAPANNVWKAIYQENCFNSPVAGGHHGTPGSALDAPDLCEEKQVFHQIISGLHASISVHICAEYLNKTTGQWQRHPQCYQYRVGNFPDRVHNVYVVYSLLLRAMAKLEPFLAHQLDICTGKPKDDAAVQTALAHLAGDLAPRYALDASRLFQGPHRTALMDEVRTRFRNVSRIMDCVSCQKCRLWGKTQVTGIGTALKVVFGLSDDMIAGKVSIPTGKPLLSRFEVVALVNTLNRFAESVRDIVAFEDELARDKALKQKETVAAADTNQSAKESLTAATKPNATARDAGDNDEHLFLWKSIASALTIAPFLFGWWYSMQGGGAGAGQREPDAPGKSRSHPPPPRSPTSLTSPRHAHHPAVHDQHDDTDTDDALDAFAHQVNQDANDADSDDEFSSSGLDMSSSGDDQDAVPPRPASAGMSAATRRRLVVDAGYEGSVDTSEADEEVVRASGKRSAAARRRPRRVD